MPDVNTLEGLLSRVDIRQRRVETTVLSALRRSVQDSRRTGLSCCGRRLDQALRNAFRPCLTTGTTGTRLSRGRISVDIGALTDPTRPVEIRHNTQYEAELNG
jgi:hypothetical protein